MDGHPQSLRGSPTNPRMVTNQPKDGNPNKEVYFRLGIWHLHKKLRLGDICHGQTPTIHRIVLHPPKDGNPPT